MARRGGVRIPIVADADGVKDGVKDAERALDKLNKSSKRAFSATKVAAGGAALAIGGGLVAALKDGFDGLQDAQKATAQLEATLKSTGNTTGWTKKEMIEWADTMERSTGIAAETTMQAESLLATFSNIGRDSFPVATRAAIDMSVAFDQSAKSSAIQLGKALQDPIKGVSALQRIGVSFTDQQKEQIKVLVEGNKVQEAQAIILGEVNKQVAHSAHAYGQTLQGRLAKAQHAWGAITEELAAKLLPAMVDLLDWVNRNMPTIERVMDRVGDTIAGVVKFVSAVIEQDWATANKLLVRAAEVAWKGIVALVKAAVPWIRDAAKDAGRAAAEGLWRGFEAGLASIPGSGALRRVLGMSSGDIDPTLRINVIGGSGVAQYRAGGGVIPGPRGAGDVVPAMLTPGEVVLNERQQRMLGFDAIRGVLAATGGVLGGTRFASGGWVFPAPGASIGGGPGQGTHSYSSAPNNWQSDTAYDLMGKDGMPVVAAYDGVVSATRPFSSDPRFWGHAAYLDVPGGQFYYKHLKSLSVSPGQRVKAGQTLGYLGTGVNGGPHLHIGATSRALLDKAVNGSKTLPKGDDGHMTDDDEARDAPPPGLSAAEFKRRVPALRRGGRATPRSIGDSPASIGRRHVDDALEVAQIRAGGGQDSDVIRHEKGELELDIRDLTREVKRLRKLRGRLRRRKKQLIKRASNPKTPRTERLKLAEALAGLNESLTNISDAIVTLSRDRTDLMYQARVMGFDLQNALRDEAETADGESTAEGFDNDPAVLAQLEQSQAAAAAATTFGQANEDFIRAAFGSGDIRSGGVNAAAASGANVTIQSLIPDDPGTLRRIQDAVTAALGSAAYVPSTTVPSGA